MFDSFEVCAWVYPAEPGEGTHRGFLRRALGGSRRGEEPADARLREGAVVASQLLLSGMDEGTDEDEFWGNSRITSVP